MSPPGLLIKSCKLWLTQGVDVALVLLGSVDMTSGEIGTVNTVGQVSLPSMHLFMCSRFLFFISCVLMFFLCFLMLLVFFLPFAISFYAV